MSETKHCPRCDQTLPVTSFHPRRVQGGHQYWCKPCQRDHTREWRKKNWRQYTAYKRARYAIDFHGNHELMAEYQREYR